MARNIAADGGPVYRAVLTSTPPGKPRATWREGPYATHGAARARVTFWTNHLRDADTGAPYASGYVERAESTWRPVDDDQPPAEQYRTDPDGRPTWHGTDVDGDRLLASVAVIPEQGPGVYFRTDPSGSSVPLDQLDAFIARLHTIADAARAATKEPRK
ncbi:hypothetical protein [Streptomyces montanisoli]|uniref:Uncharacterized protein n=1 Tax=Streptomyces montanisoli TaxID=2798581 RepID=A0A940RW36_9ACTN|nr:hypothetical protein [Streptomyces montanisoli]MBP0456234.1 hypothetical protein [Streptomyces montanisoli]